MKHPWVKIAVLLTWLFLSVVLGLSVVPFAYTHHSVSDTLSPWVAIPLVVGMILLSAFVFIKLLKKPKVKVEQWFAIATAIIVGNTMVKFFFQTDSVWVMFAWYLVFALPTYWIFTFLITRMQESWANVIKYAQWSNLILLTSIVFAAASISSELTPLTAMIILGFIAIYDAIMVWKMEKMQELAAALLKRRVLLGIAVPYEYEVDKFALLGGGDVFFIVLASAVFYKTSQVTMWIMAASMLASIVLLFAFSKKEKSYPAIPFIFAAALVGLGIAWMVV